MKIYLKKQRVVFFIGLLAVVLAGAILFTSAFGGILHFSNKILAKSGFQSLIKFFSEKFYVLGQTAPLFFSPHFPQRLAHIASEIAEISEKLVPLNEELLSLTNECDCQYAESQCKQEKTPTGQFACTKVGVFGEPCPREESRGGTEGPTGEEGPTIEEKQSEIRSLTLRLFFLETLLNEEMMGTAFEKQLATLIDDDKEILMENLTKLSYYNPKILTMARTNTFLVDQCSVEPCQTEADCQPKSLSFNEGCLSVAGHQKPIELKLGVGIGLSDIEPGEIGIKDVKLNLPERIEIPGLSEIELPSFAISIPDITLTCPIDRQTIAFSVPTPSLPKAPTLELSCPADLTSQEYKCQENPQGAEQKYLPFEWYIQTFNWLSGGKPPSQPGQPSEPENCQALAQREYGMPREECLDPARISGFIVEQCDNLWRTCALLGTCGPPPVGSLPTVCSDIGAPEGILGINIEDTRQEAPRYRCEDLFRKIGEPNPNTCISNPISTIQEKCEQLATTGQREIAPKECMVLPLFTGNLTNPTQGEISGQATDCSNQTIIDRPNPAPGCSLSAPSVPKIPLSKYSVEIPDIPLPDFNFWPFFSVNLPDFTFEDLTLPDIELCNLDECRLQFPNLSFQIPTLRIPQIGPLSASINIPDVPQIDVSIKPIEFPPFSFNFSHLFNLSSFTVPQIALPSLQLPKPTFRLTFDGFNIDWLGLILGQLVGLFPDNLCFSLPEVGLNISYPNYIFDWPAFPRIPNACENVNQFCQDANDDIGKISSKADEIQQTVNYFIQEEIQSKLDYFASEVRQAIITNIQDQLDDVAEEIKKEIINYRGTYSREHFIPFSSEELPAPGILPIKRELPCDKIPPLRISGSSLAGGNGEIIVSAKPLSDFVSLPESIAINWPSELKDTISVDMSYPFPTIHLSHLSYEKDVNIRLPGFQLASPAINFELLQKQSASECVSLPPKSKNPCQEQANLIQANSPTIREINEEIKQASQKIIDVLY